MGEIRRGKALALIVESATVTDSDGNQVELATLNEDGTYASSEEAGDLDEDRADENPADENPADENPADENADTAREPADNPA